MNKKECNLNVIVCTADAFTGNPEVLTTTTPFLAAQQNTPFILEIDTYTNLSAAGNAQVTIDDTDNTLVLVDKRGYDVRADRLLREIMYRAHACGIEDVSMTSSVAPEKFSAFKCVVATDPNRLIVLDCLPRSTYIGDISDGTGITVPVTAP